MNPIEATRLDEKELAQLFVGASLKSSQQDFLGESGNGSKEAALADLARVTAGNRGPSANAIFARECLTAMSQLDLTADSVYRAFDSLDQVLGSDYSVDDLLKVHESERLYEGGGVGVQTSYSSLLTTLKLLNLKSGSLFIDLGSGFGRVGFALGLLRPDVEFIGYEFVEERVVLCQKICAELELPNVVFETRNLSSHDFKIPAADVYYMFDPFNAETYGYVLSQLIEIGRQKQTVIVTKGRANTWASKTLENAGWTFVPMTDLGAIVTFTSPTF